MWIDRDKLPLSLAEVREAPLLRLEEAGVLALSVLLRQC